MADASILATGVAVRDHSYPQIFVNIVRFCPFRPHLTINECPGVGHRQAGVIQGLDKIPDKIPDTRAAVVCHDILSSYLDIKRCLPIPISSSLSLIFHIHIYISHKKIIIFCFHFTTKLEFHEIFYCVASDASKVSIINTLHVGRCPVHLDLGKDSPHKRKLVQFRKLF